MTTPGAGTATGLVLIDLQNDFIHPEGVFARNGLVTPNLGELLDNVNQLVEQARRAIRPIYWITTIWESDADCGLIGERSPNKEITSAHRRGSWGAQIHASMYPHPDDRIIEKRRFSAFFQTDFDRLLREDGVTRLVAAGVRTDFCVESTVRDAFFRDLRVTVVESAVAGYFPELHEASLRQMQTVFAEVAPQATGLDRLRLDHRV